MLQRCKCGFSFIENNQYKRFNLLLEEDTGRWGLVCSDCGVIYIAPFDENKVNIIEKDITIYLRLGR